MNRRVNETSPKKTTTRPIGFFRQKSVSTNGPTSGSKADGFSSRGPRNKVGAGYLVLLFLILVLASCAFVYHLRVRFNGVRLGYEASQARALQTRLLLERRELRLELASLKSPGRVESDARERLSMEVPDHKKIITVGTKRRVVSVSGGAL